MLRLTLLLSAAMLAALYTLGEDRGQLRPGLAMAAAEGRLDEVWAEARAKAERQPARLEPAAPSPVLAAALVSQPVPEPPPLQVASPVVTERIEPVVEVSPGREVVSVLQEPVFSLAAYGNEAVPGESDSNVARAADAAPTGGSVWYVNANSVNVRAAPSTDAEVLDRLGNGEAALLVAAVDADWARIVIEGDGLEGYVALRYLTQTAP
jgi:hypothetical protein